MKKITAVLLVCLMVLLVGGTLAAQPDQKASIMLEGFDDLTAEDINNPAGAVTEPDDHSSWGLGDGAAQLVDGDVRQGLAMIPDYVGEYGSYVLRSTYKRTGTEYGSEERVAAVREAWANADGFRFYVKNMVDDNITLQVHLTLNVTDLGEDMDTVTITSYLGTKLYNIDGEEEEVVFDTPDIWKNTRIIIPWGFEGWVDIPLTIAGVDGNSRDGEYGWFFPETYTDESQIEQMLNSGQINFNNIKAGIQLDFRLVPWAGILDEDNPDEFNIIVDSLQLYNNTDGDITYLPDDGTPDLPPETPRPEPDDTPKATNEPAASKDAEQSASATDPAQSSASAQPGEKSGSNNIWLIVVIVVVVVAAVIVIVAVAAKKKKKPSDNE